MLDLSLVERRGAFTLDATLRVPDRSVMVLVGESGSGKTTLLRAIAGLERPDAGGITVDGATWFDAARGEFLPPAQRSVGYVAQDYALFPHLSVMDNVMFGPRAARLPAAPAAARTAATMDRLGIAALARRRPHELSGGQRQRVALARALVLEPRVLLLDEPLSALDVQSRRAIRGELRRLLDGLTCTTVYVTHAPSEALAFGEQIAVLEDGRVSQCGSRDDLMRHPRSPYVAEFLGVNFFRASRAAPVAGGATISIPHGELAVMAPGAEGDVTLVVHPREITLARERPAGSARNVFAGVIAELVPEPPAGERVRVTLATVPPLTAEVTREAVDALGLVPGMRVFASFKASGVVVVP